MCGIAGMIGPDAREARRQVVRMLHALRHRGPDGEGILVRDDAPGRNGVVLGHRRLSIIDLSSAAGQPMTSSDGNLHVVLNGEIYNYLELREQLERAGRRFRTRSDTEVLLEAWSAWGSETLERVVGMFAFALLDETRRVLVLARDQFAMKPLYYAATSAGLAIASEIPPLLDLPGVSRRVDPGALADFLSRGVNNHQGRTMFADAREIPGAHWAEIPLDGPLTVTPRRYWRPADAQAHDMPFDAAVEQFRSLFEDSVRLHLRSDVPVGFLLSGGQDSTSTLLMARRILGSGADLHAFSYRGGDGAVDEGPWIDAARSAAGAIGHDVRVTADEWGADLATLVAAQGEPFASPVLYAQRRLFGQAAAEGVRVVLDGQGSDEYLAGYDRFYPGLLASLLHRGRAAEFLRTARGFVAGGAGWSGTVGSALALRWPRARAVLRPRAEPIPLLDPRWAVERGAATSPRWRPKGRDVLREMLAASLTTHSIPWLMRYADRNAMAYSIENRLPFLNARLVDFTLGLPEEYFITSGGTGKNILREAMRGLVPDVIRERRDKIGFDVPVEAWLSATPAVPELLSASRELGPVARGHAERLKTALGAGRRLTRSQAFEAWRLVTLVAWSREFGVAYH